MNTNILLKDFNDEHLRLIVNTYAQAGLPTRQNLMEDITAKLVIYNIRAYHQAEISPDFICYDNKLIIQETYNSDLQEECVDVQIYPNNESPNLVENIRNLFNNLIKDNFQNEFCLQQKRS